MKFSVPTIAMLASSASIASATTIVKTYIASPASSNNSTATDSGAGSRHLSSASVDSVSASTKSSKASGKSGKANPTGVESYTVCIQALDLIYFTSSNLELPDPSVNLPFKPESLKLGYLSSGNFAISELIGNIGCAWFGLNRTACDDDGYTPVTFPALTSTAYATATGSNPLEFTGSGGVFSDRIPGEDLTTAGEGLITTYSLKCATPPVTKFETKQGLRPANICAFEFGVQITELDLISETEGTIALYPESDGVVCDLLKEE